MNYYYSSAMLGTKQITIKSEFDDEYYALKVWLKSINFDEGLRLCKINQIKETQFLDIITLNNGSVLISNRLVIIKDD